MNVPIHRRFDAGMTQQLLQHLRLHTAFDCTRCVGVAQSVHTESPDFCLIAQFVKVGIVGTVFCRFLGTPVDKDKITHDQPGDCPRSPVDIFQCLREQRRFFLPRALVLDFFQNFIGPICQRDGAIELCCVFGGPARQKCCLWRYSKVLLTVSVQFWKSIASHVSPIISPVRKPVSRISAY